MIPNYTRVRLLTDRYREQGAIRDDGEYLVDFSDACDGVTYAQIDVKEDEIETCGGDAPDVGASISDYSRVRLLSGHCKKYGIAEYNIGFVVETVKPGPFRVEFHDVATDEIVATHVVESADLVNCGQTRRQFLR